MRISTTIALAGLLALHAPAASALLYSFELSSIPGEGQIIGRDINEAGEIVGSVDSFETGDLVPSGFALRGGVFDVFQAPRDFLNGTAATGIDGAGRIVGDAGGRGFLLEAGVFTPFEVPGSWSTQVSDVSEGGIIVGRTFLDSDPQIGTAFLRMGDQYSFFRPPDAYAPYGISFDGVNDLGNTVGTVLDEEGFRAFAILDGVYMPFSIPGSLRTQARGINDRNQIVGTYDDAGETHGFLMDATGLYRIDVPAGIAEDTFLQKINDGGVIVGAAGFDRFPVREVLVATPCEAVSDSCFSFPRIGDPLIRFVPEPTTVVLLASGLVGLAARRGTPRTRKRR